MQDNPLSKGIKVHPIVLSELVEGKYDAWNKQYENSSKASLINKFLELTANDGPTGIDHYVSCFPFLNIYR